MDISLPCCLLGGLAFNPITFDRIRRANPRSVFIDINQLNGLDLDVLSDQVAKNLAGHLTWQVIAYSCGGLIAIRLAKNHPKLVHRILFINSSPRFMCDFDWHGISYPAYQRLFSKLSNPVQFCNYFKKLCNYPRPVLADNSCFNTPPELKLANLMKLILITDLRNELNLLTVQISFIYSELDILVPFNPLTFDQYLINDSTHLEINSKQLLDLVEGIR